jgi:hypothetical protein
MKMTVDVHTRKHTHATRTENYSLVSQGLAQIQEILDGMPDEVILNWTTLTITFARREHNDTL